MLQEIDPSSVGILFQDRYRIVRCIKGETPNAEHDVVDENANACCLLEVVAPGAVAVEKMDDPLEIESTIEMLLEKQQTTKALEPTIDETTEEICFILEDDIDEYLETNPLPRDEFNADQPHDTEASNPAPVVSMPIPIPPIHPSLVTKPAGPLPPPLRANPLPQVPPPLPATSSPLPSVPPTRKSPGGGLPSLNPPPRFRSKNGDLTPDPMPQLIPVFDMAALVPSGNELLLHERIDPLVAPAAQNEILPSAPKLHPLRDSWRRHRVVAVMFAIGFALLTLGLWGLWTHRTQDVRMGETNRREPALEPAKSEKVAHAPISTHSTAVAPPLTGGTSQPGVQRAAPVTTTKKIQKSVRGTGRTPSPTPKTKPSRESLY